MVINTLKEDDSTPVIGKLIIFYINCSVCRLSQVQWSHSIGLTGASVMCVSLQSES